MNTGGRVWPRGIWTAGVLERMAMPTCDAPCEMNFEQQTCRIRLRCAAHMKQMATPTCGVRIVKFSLIPCVWEASFKSGSDIGLKLAPSLPPMPDWVAVAAVVVCEF